jgi:succinyl-CoA synthetase beta subunit
MRVGQTMTGNPTIREIDLNPVIVYPDGQGVMALDALMLVD